MPPEIVVDELARADASDAKRIAMGADRQATITATAFAAHQEKCEDAHSEVMKMISLLFKRWEKSVIWLVGSLLIIIAALGALALQNGLVVISG